MKLYLVDVVIKWLFLLHVHLVTEMALWFIDRTIVYSNALYILRCVIICFCLFLYAKPTIVLVN